MENNTEPVVTKNIMTYKIYQQDENEITKRIIVFHGKNEEVKSLSEYFNDLEIAEIQEQKTQILFSKLQIHNDDTIETIKLKLIMELGAETISYNEIYLYSKIKGYLYLEAFYREVTQNEQTPFTREMLGQLLMNLEWDKTVINDIPIKENYTYEDLIKYTGDETEEHDILIPLGLRFSSTRNLLFSADPFEVLLDSNGATIFQQNGENPIMAFMNSTLLSYGEIQNRKIYLCFLNEVLDYSNINRVDEKYMLNLYFPELQEENIESAQDYLDAKTTLINKNKQYITPRLQTLYKTVDLYWNVFNSKTQEIEYTKRGITYFEFVIHPLTKTKLPLEAIFKNVHATKSHPYIKYNPGNRKENIYRLYYEKTTKTGKKIPTLTKGQINILSKQSGKGNQITFYVLCGGGSAAQYNMEIFIDIEQNANVKIRCVSSELATPITRQEMEEIYVKHVVPVITEINTFLQQTGYNIHMFSSLTHEMVEILQIKYRCESNITEELNLNKYTALLSSVFEIIDISNIQKGASLRFKRVDNYRKMNAIHAFIADVFKRTNDEVQVINGLLVNEFVTTEDEAISEIAKFFSTHPRIQQKFANKKIDIVENPGFPVTMKTTSDGRNFSATVENILTIEQVEDIELYMDSFLQITQIPDTIENIPRKIIDDLSLTKKEAKKSTNAEITAKKTEMVIVPAIQPFQLIRKKIPDSMDEDEEADDAEADDDDDDIFLLDSPVEDEEQSPDEETGINEDETQEETTGGVPSPEEDDDDDDETNSSPIQPDNTVTQSNDKFNRLSTKYFLNRKKELEPDLFLTAKEGRYKAYTRACPLQRQPVILTDEEKKKIDKENRNAYTYAVKYGTKPDKKYWYVCPRFWCMDRNKNTPLTEEQVRNGECSGKIHEFTSNDHIKDGEYRNHYPGFLPKGVHPTSCVPCCFKKSWDTNSQQTRRSECNIKKSDISIPNKTTPESSPSDDANAAAETTIVTANQKNEQSIFYIISFESYPLDENRWGFLSPSVLLFLQINYNEVVIKNKPALIKSGATTLLRYGVEQSRHQSFIGCIADIYASINRYKSNGKPVPKIKEFRAILQKAVTLDFFIKCHNGSLVSIFQPKKMAISQDILQKYANTEFYSKIDQTDDNQYDFFQDTVASYENFLKFLGDDDAIIDHTYLWDIVSSKNNNLFPSGINLVIMEIADNGITDETVEVLCPTNSYMDKFYDKSRETVILLKREEYYEPIYMYNITATEKGTNSGTVNTTETFSEQIAPPYLKKFLAKIQNANNKYCRGLPSMSWVYTFKQNHPAVNILRSLKKYDYYVDKQVINYRGKVIGFSVSQNKDMPLYFFVPTFPSSQLNDISTVYMDDVKWVDYETTRDFLVIVAKTTKGEVLSAPSLKVVENSLIIGILTETNQFIQTDPPIPNDIMDEIPVFQSRSFGENGYYDADKILATKTAEDPERKKVVQRVHLETQFYTAFRTTIRIVLNEFKNREFREKIVQYIEDESLLNIVKRKKIETLLKMVMKPHFIFNDLSDEQLNELGEISTCTADCKTSKFCLVKDDEGDQEKQCVLILPNRNLVTGENNNTKYFVRISDELLRYKRIQLFMLKPKKYLNIAKIEYKINPNEFLLLHSLLDGNYFENLVPFQTNSYVKNIPFDFANPSITNRYSSKVTLKEQQRGKEFVETIADGDDIFECVKETLNEIIDNTKGHWRKTFPVGTREVVFNNTKDCTFYMLIDIIKKHRGSLVSVETVKTALIRRYNELGDKYMGKILTLLSGQGGKSELIKKVQTSRITLEQLIMSEEYYLTNLDLWALISYFNLPVMFFSNANLVNLKLSVKWVVLGGDRINDVYFFVRPSDESGVIPEYHVLNPTCKLGELRNNFFKMINNETYIENNLEFETYLETHIK